MVFFVITIHNVRTKLRILEKYATLSSVNYNQVHVASPYPSQLEPEQELDPVLSQVPDPPESTSHTVIVPLQPLI